MMILQKISGRIVDIVSILILGFLFVVSLTESCTIAAGGLEKTVYLSDSVWVNAAAILVVVVGICFMQSVCDKSRSYRYLYAVPAVVYVVTALYSVWTMQPNSDQMECTTAAAGLLEGDYSAWEYGGYCYINPHQNGLVLFFSLVFRIFGVNNYRAIFIINIAFYFGMVCLIRGCIALFTESSALCGMVWTVMLLYYPMICYTGFAYGTMPGLFFTALAVWFYLRSERTDIRTVRAALTLAACCALFLAICMKSNYMIPAIAIILVCAVRALSEKSLAQAVWFAAFALAFAAGARLPNLYFEMRTGNPTDEGIPVTAYIEMGLQRTEITSPGWFNSYNYNIYVIAGANHALANELATADLRITWAEYQENPVGEWEFFSQKAITQWNNVDFMAHGVLFDRTGKDTDILSLFLDDGSRYHDVYLWILDRMMSVVYFGSICFLLLHRKKTYLVYRLAYIMFLGGFLFHLFWEGKSQYVVIYFVMLMPMAVCGIWKLAQALKKIPLPAHSRSRT